jgi:hypothetical protein
MAVTRSSSAKKVVHKAVAVKVTKSSGRKYVSWDDSYTQLLALSKKEGHCRPHFSTTLGKWCTQQRADFQANFQANKPLLHQYQIEKLSKNGFQFCVYNKNPTKQLKWIDRYNQLVDYKNEHGHANPPAREGRLGTWCKPQHAIFQNQFGSTGKMTLYQHQINKLVEIGFLFNLPLGRPNPNLRAWPDMPALPDMPTLPAWPDMPPTVPVVQTLSSLTILPDCVPPVPNVIAV